MCSKVEAFKQELFALYEKHNFVLLVDSVYHAHEIVDLNESNVEESKNLMDETWEGIWGKRNA